jgi:hypothetical protein
MRVMVVVMVQSQHELLKVSHSGHRVNSENSMQLIGIADAKPSPQGAQGSHKSKISEAVRCASVSRW